MDTKQQGHWLEIPVIRGTVLGVNVYRGYAKLCDLSRISKADIYDQVKNPSGTQRDLNSRHAREAYEYVKTKEFAFWPEVFLCVRNSLVARFVTLKGGESFGLLQIDLDLAKSQDEIAISRVDGNHRLHFASGEIKDFPSLDTIVSFCLAYDLNRDQEIILFKDINDNQKSMSTSHLDNIEVRITPEDELKKKSPDLYIADKLGKDPKSPLYKRVHGGGKKSSGVDVPLRALHTGIGYMFSRSTQLTRVPNVDGQYVIVRNFFSAVKKWQPKAWSYPREYIVLRGVGLWAICFLGAHVIDKVLLIDKVGTEDMLEILNSGKKWDWTSKGEFKGFSGRSGALEISRKVSSQFNDGTRLSSADLYKKILEEE